MRTLQLLPAVDVAAGEAVQLVQGVAGTERVFGDPVEAALRWQQAGSRWIHLVDLDAAFGRGDNRAVLADVDAARAAYRERCRTLGRAVRLHLPGDTAVEGLAEEVDDVGRLVVGGRAYGAGDVVHLRPAGQQDETP